MLKSCFSRFQPGLLLLVLLTALGVFSACDKDKEKDYTAIDEALIKQYVADHKLANAQRQESGLYFVPIKTTAGVQPQRGQTVSVLYTGMRLDSTIFDSTSKRGNQPFPFVLGAGQVIKGWDEGIALLKRGEQGMLLIPSRLGYGAQAVGPIPANSVLRFDVELVEVQ